LRNNGRRNLPGKENYMRTAFSMMAAFLLVLTLAMTTMAQDTGRLNGEILDREGKPYADVTVTIKNTETGISFTVKTDKSGKFVQLGMKPGIYSITSTNAKDNFTYSEKMRIVDSQENNYKLSVKDALAASGPSAEEQKKQEEAANKFKNMKVHFDTGVQALNEANGLKTQIRTVPADQRTALQEKRTADCVTAATELAEAEQGVPEKEVKNHALVLANLGQAQECEGKFDDASTSLQKAIDMAPQASYYTELATSQANAGAAATDPKVAETQFAAANATCDKDAALDPVAGGTCWKNVGIVLSNKGRMKDAIVPLQKATTADPKDAQTWMMLGNAMTATIEPKQEGDKMTYVIPPGTKEAYQKAIDLSPGTATAKQAQDALDGLNAMTGGEDTSVGKKKKK
jgi:tetratricopeptide (TPR) repeat protein